MPDQSIAAIKAVTINEGFFQGHFPGRPIMPGVLIVEALAQAAGRARGRNRSASRTRASWSISWRSKARSSAPRSSPACLLQLEVEFVQKRTTRLQVRRPGAGRRQARRRSPVHGDDRRSAGGLSGRPPGAAAPLDPEHRRNVRPVEQLAGRRRRRRVPWSMTISRSAKRPARSRSCERHQHRSAGLRGSASADAPSA